ncbi:MAG: AAA family ATPase [Lachnospiraceae bacterium]|nr:AAA family ATPase [Lachnospiraceae bacterium]
MNDYLNTGNESFQRALRARIYVDKTGMIEYTNSVLGTDDAFICVSRPRRFGKSMAANMLAAYYDRSCDSSTLFCGRKAEKLPDFKTHLNQYDVIFLNIQQILSAAGNADLVPQFIQSAVIHELHNAYPESVSADDSYLPSALASIYKKDTRLHKGFVFIVDEWDCMFREAKDHTNAQKHYLDFLKDLFKDRTYVALAYMTGILPIKKYGSHSALNIFSEFSMTDPSVFAEYTGFTEEEVISLCSTYEKDFDEVRQWYDGYRFAENLHIYNPKSVVDGMKSRKLKSFWTKTETYEALQLYIDLDMDGLKQALIGMLGGNSCAIDVRTFQNDMTSLKSRDDILTLLVHLGYLAYDEISESVSIPNEEIREEFMRAVRTGGRPELIRAIQLSDHLLQAAVQMNSSEVGRILEDVHRSIASPDFYNNEQALRSTIRFAFLSSMDEFVTIQELPSGNGYADIVFLPFKHSDKPILVVELKWDKSTADAIEQIKRRQYPEILQAHGSDILLIGINYSKRSKKHTCIIERHTKSAE